MGRSSVYHTGNTPLELLDPTDAEGAIARFLEDGVQLLDRRRFQWSLGPA